MGRLHALRDWLHTQLTLLTHTQQRAWLAQELVGMAVALQSSGETIGTVVDLYDGTGVLPLTLNTIAVAAPAPLVY